MAAPKEAHGAGGDLKPPPALFFNPAMQNKPMEMWKIALSAHGKSIEK